MCAVERVPFSSDSQKISPTRTTFLQLSSVFTSFRFSEEKLEGPNAFPEQEIARASEKERERENRTEQNRKEKKRAEPIRTNETVRV